MRLPIAWGRIQIRPIHLVADAIIIAACVYISVLLRVGSVEFFDFLPVIHRYLPLVVVIRLGFLIAFSGYNIIWRYVSASDAFRLGQSVLASTALIVIVSFFLTDSWGRLPRSVYFIDSALVLSALMATRLTRRLQIESQNRRQTRSGLRTLIYGAGVNGRTIASRFRSDPGLNGHVIGFLDDAPEKRGVAIGNVKVLGTRHDFEGLVRDLEIQHLVIAIHSLPMEVLREMVTICARHGIRPLITSHFGSQETNSWRDHQIVRPISLHDLLNRPAREMDLRSVQDLVRGRRVLVTGAGGSIGSEISRQVASHSPARLVLLDHSEFGIFEIDKELRTNVQRTEKVTPVLMDLKDHPQLDRLVKEFKPEIVIHAAAYKHVHLAEENPCEVIRNNVLGTQNLLQACRQNGVEIFLLISTDKAVNPAGIMGATKRACELMTTMAAMETGRRYCSVRFGNVLGSSGSLIPILESQIRQGGPVTITHPEMTRYFMLIPEAVSLVLRACSLAKPGDVNVLKMGEPVKILDIARNMMTLSGKTEQEIPIVFTGTRPGEKLSEELYLRGDELQTEHPEILTLPMGAWEFNNDPRAVARFSQSINNLIAMAENNLPTAAAMLFETVQPRPKSESPYTTVLPS
jgi:FlaA1/EpsC-like NDP-sugar epimerase